MINTGKVLLEIQDIPINDQLNLEARHNPILGIIDLQNNSTLEIISRPNTFVESQ